MGSLFVVLFVLNLKITLMNRMMLVNTVIVLLTHAESTSGMLCLVRIMDYSLDVDLWYSDY